MTKKNAKKAAARTRVQALGGKYQHHLRQVGGAEGDAVDGANVSEKHVRFALRQHLVLDTNCFRGLSEEELRQVANLGLPVRVSEVALAESLARSVLDFETGKMDRRKARGHFFGRLRRVQPYLDPIEPVADVHGKAIEILRASLTGIAPHGHAQHIAAWRDGIRRLISPELTDEQWIEHGHESQRWLDRLDRLWAEHNLPEEVIWKRRFPAPEVRARKRDEWSNFTISDRYHHALNLNIEYFGFSEQECVRTDAMLRVWTWRMLNSSHDFGRARRNDGADIFLPQHVSTGGVLLTNDKKLLGAVEASGTRHGPWIRSFDEAVKQPLPPCFPWEERADHVRTTFKRVSVQESEIHACRWPEME